MKQRKSPDAASKRLQETLRIMAEVAAERRAKMTEQQRAWITIHSGGVRFLGIKEAPPSHFERAIGQFVLSYHDDEDFLHSRKPRELEVKWPVYPYRWYRNVLLGVAAFKDPAGPEYWSPEGGIDAMLLAALARPVVASFNSRRGARAGGKKTKRRAIIDAAILAYLREHPDASNKEVWESFPESREDAETVGDDLAHSVFRDREEICQEDSGGKSPKISCIGREKFDDYMTRAREELVISTRQKKRHKE